MGTGMDGHGGSKRSLDADAAKRLSSIYTSKRPTPIVESLRSGKATLTEIIQVTTRLRTKILSEPIASNLSRRDLACLILLLDSSVNVSTLQSLEAESKRKIAKAKEILLKRGKPEPRIRKALAIIGLSIKSTRQEESKLMGILYTDAWRRHGVKNKKGRWQLILGYNGLYNRIEWSTLREKKTAILDALKTRFQQKSRTAVLAQLKKLKIKNLPAYDNSGLRNSR